MARRFYNAPVAQPDRVVASEAIGRGFESLRARQLNVLQHPKKAEYSFQIKGFGLFCVRLRPI